MFSRPRSAATLMILRNGVNGGGQSPEVLMLLRHPGNKFVPLNYVYPGGAVDEEDTAGDIIDRCRGIVPLEAMNIIPEAKTPEYAMGFWIAAIRETFEETGILYAVNSNGDPVTLSGPEEKERFSRYRREIHEKKLSLYSMLEREGLFPDAGRIFFFSRWITPPFSSIRYDAHFFVAGFPEGQDVRHDGKELTEHVWISPAEALAKYRQGNFRMVLPTVETIREAGRYQTIEDAISGLSQSKYRNVCHSG
ncbi:MAG TPA: hypothetical protein PK544_09890 [Spirochaetota bacterium]|nr:hypothetical protein [Spirochaetota bacterium]HPQ52936.1 hypothetical protein [Spirochaetota bacterium]